MMRRIVAAAIAGVLASCGQSSGTGEAAKASSDTPTATMAATPATTVSGSNPCTLVSNPEALFGRAVTAQVDTMPNKTRICTWNATDRHVCGSVTVFGPGWNEVPDVPLNYKAMVTSLGAFGSTKDIAGIGEEAQIVDAGMLGSQIAFRTGKAAVIVGASCGEDRVALVEKLARAVAGKL